MINNKIKIKFKDIMMKMNYIKCSKKDKKHQKNVY